MEEEILEVDSEFHVLVAIGSLVSFYFGLVRLYLSINLFMFMLNSRSIHWRFGHIIFRLLKSMLSFLEYRYFLYMN